MYKLLKTIEIVSSTEPGLSSMGSVSRTAAQVALAYHYTDVRVTVINTIEDLERLVARKPDLVFLGMSFLPVHANLGRNDTERIWLSEYLDRYDIAYTGSNQQAHALERSKPLSKERVAAAGLATSRFMVAELGTIPPEQTLKLNYPLFVKPTDLGGGSGIDSKSVVMNYKQLCAKITVIHSRLQTSCLIEEYLPGREFSVAVLKNEHVAGYMAMPIELIAPVDGRGNRLLSSQIKSADTERFQAVTDVVLRQSLSNFALDVFYALGARDYGRIDIRLDAQGIPHFLEANLIPSLVDNYANFLKACKLNQNIPYGQVLSHITNLAFARTDTPSLDYATSYQIAIV